MSIFKVKCHFFLLNNDIQSLLLKKNGVCNLKSDKKNDILKKVIEIQKSDLLKKSDKTPVKH